MSVPPPRPKASPVVTTAPKRDDGRKPRSLPDRLRLGLILLVLPSAAVCVPIVVTSQFFGQRPQPKTTHTEGLQQSLQQSADHLFPGTSTIGSDAITVTVRADHFAARMKKISDQAQAFGGSASEGLSTSTEKRLSVDLPAGRTEAFRQAVMSNSTPESLTPSVASPASAGRDYVDVVIRAAGDDE